MHIESPKPDTILCTGMPRSGSTWSYNVCMRLLEKVYPDADVAGLYAENVGDILAQRLTDYLVIKCHGIDAAGRADE